jgi:hypothetical protein
MKRLAVWLGILFTVFFFGMGGLAFAGQSPSISLYVNDSTGVASGIAIDPDLPGQAIAVRFYINAPWPNGTAIGTIYTNSDGQYSWQLPSTYQDGVTRSLYAYALDYTDGHGLTSTTFTWEEPRYSPTISLSVNNITGVASGIATDQDRPGQPIEIHFYLNAPWPSGTIIGSTYTNSSGQYSWQLPSTYQDGVTRTLYAYGIDNTDGHGLTSTTFTWEEPRYSPRISLSVNNITGVASGTASDQDRPGEPVTIRFYMDGNYLYGTDLGEVSTNSSTTQYTFQLPSQYQDGQAHTLYAYAIDFDDGHTETSVSFTWEIQNQYVPHGVVNAFQPGDTTITGWAQDQDYPSTPLTVHLRINNQWYVSSTANPNYSLTIPSEFLAGGTYNVKVTVKDAIESTWSVLGYTTIDNNPNPPQGVVNAFQPGDTAITGSVQDQDDPDAALEVHLRIDGEWQVTSTANPGFSLSIPSEFLTGGGPYFVEITVKDAFESTWYVLGTTTIPCTIDCPPSEIEVPDVTDMPQSDAEAAILAAGLTVGDVETEYHVTVPEGNVISQDPEAGEIVEEEFPVNLVVSEPEGQLEFGLVSVGGGYVTVNLSKTYVSPVVVCSVQYNNNTTPVVARVNNVTSNSFDVRLQNPSNGSVNADNVSYLVVEEGVWTIDGVNIEAQSYLSTVTDENNSWVGQVQTYGQSYTNPVVLGQVMSENNSHWSVFWCQGTARGNPPSATALKTGKTVCEDTVLQRADEIIGFVVIEAGHGVINGVEFEAAVGSDIVQGAVQSAPYTYTFNSAFSSAPQVVVATTAGMDGGDGCWAQTHGPTPASTTNLYLSVDEDQIGDSERYHTTEQVGYIAFSSTPEITIEPHAYGVPIILQGDDFPIDASAYDSEDGDLTSEILYTFENLDDGSEMGPFYEPIDTNLLSFGRYRVTLSVTDSANQNKSEETYMVVIPNEPPAAWSGPTTSFITENGVTKIRICDVLGCRTGLPIYLGLVRGENEEEWDRFVSQAIMLCETEDLIPIVLGHVHWRGYDREVRIGGSLNSASYHEDEIGLLIGHLYEAMPENPPYLLLRIRLHNTEEADNLGCRVLQNDVGETIEDREESEGELATLSQGWINAQKAEIESFLEYADHIYPGRIIGLKILDPYRLSTEWFVRPRVKDGNFSADPDRAIHGYPWYENNSSTFYYADYSYDAESSFIAWSGYDRLPTVAERNLQDGTTMFLDPGQPIQRRAAEYNRFFSHRTVNAITQLGAKAKEVMEGKGITSVFYGYLYAMKHDLTGSGHAALSEILDSNHIDELSGPHSYGNARNLGYAFVPHGPVDSMALHGKVWIHEDDTRTHLASDDGHKTAVNEYDTARFIWRNSLTSVLHGNGSYYFDLWREGWFDSPKIWETYISQVITQANKVNINLTGGFVPEITLFVDDLSPSYNSLIDPAGVKTYSFMSSIYTWAVEELTKLGAPVRHYLLSDLLNADVPLDDIKFAMILNGFNIPDNLRAAITNKLKNNNRTILFIYAAGYLRGDSAPSGSNILDLTGIDVRKEDGSNSNLMISPAYGSWTPCGWNYEVKDWFSVNATGSDVVIGKYSDGTPALVKRDFGDHTIIYSAVSDLSSELYRILAEDAGVSMYGELGDVVEAAGNTLLLHPNEANEPGTRTIALPGGSRDVYVNRVQEGTGSATGEVLKCNSCEDYYTLTNVKNKEIVVIRIE